MAYDTTEAVAKFLSGFQMKITNRERDTVAPDYYVKYSLTLSKGGKDFSTTFVSDGEPTVTQVFSALADDALTLRKYSTDEFVDKLYAQGVKPSAALRAYDSCKETNLWMQDELYLSGWEIEEISKTLTKYEDEVNTLVEKAASERAVRYAYDHPKLPKGFVTIEQLQGDLDLGDLRDEVEDFDFDGDITEAFGETADNKVDDNYHALLTWLPDHTEWLEEAEFNGLLEGCKGDIYKMVQMAQYECFKSDLYDHREDICRYGLDGCLTYELNAYSGVPAAAHRASYPLVEFYDTSQDAARFPGGQFVSRYYMTDLLEDDSIAVSLDTMLKNGNQFSLDGGIPAWTVEGDDLAKVNDFLKKSCMEFSGSLPGDEKDEDGYSLSGEAKDATASRNGLSRNQMGIEEKAAECKEAATVLANGNAL